LKIELGWNKTSEDEKTTQNRRKHLVEKRGGLPLPKPKTKQHTRRGGGGLKERG